VSVAEDLEIMLAARERLVAAPTDELLAHRADLLYELERAKALVGVYDAMIAAIDARRASLQLPGEP